MEHHIDVRDLRKSYGAAVALDGISFRVAPGHVTGFVGPNGAGKTTTMRIILGLAAPTSGTATVAGRTYREVPSPLRLVGSLLDAGAVHPARRADHHLLWLAQATGLSRARVPQVLEVVGLGSVAKKRVGTFSLGMRQRLGIAAALLGDPPILVLDEPTNGLDPEGIWWMRGLLRDLASEGRAILVSSHLMAELEGVASHILVLGRGRILADSTTEELLRHASAGRVLVLTDHAPAALSALAAAAPGRVEPAGPDRVTVAGLTSAQVLRVLEEAHVPLPEVRAYQATLEDAYRDLTVGSVDHAGAGHRGEGARP